MNGDDMLQAAASLRVVRGAPDEAELAALVAGMVAMASAAADEDGPGAPASAWMDRTRRMQGRRLMLPLGRGDDAWRHSLR
ncbi:acyl-CoA carboxylase subunit epsilon [Demequina capsici]|uniref:Acyl-CoA carboxylase subunit epsilon n=1 Tax=Demequina capsici TaxID=3075620 RepID=A0AA96J879_9MICO|nr:acyl-CoA carboxylase subunit epsilon [Demequina sp. OYTSA14]WNM25155.1 acyl-CoA carboxylase subunit epsilon [Demequina sp. OYTSA14]